MNGHASSAHIYAYLTLASVVALFSVIVCSLDTLPFTDVPFRMAAAVIYAAENEPAEPGLRDVLAHYKPTVTAGTPTSLFIRFAGSMGSVAVPALTDAWLCAYFAALPFVAVLILRRFGGHPMSAVPVVLLLFNFSVAWGLLEFAWAIVLVLLVVLGLVVYEQTGRRRALAGVSLLLMMLFWCHLLALLFAIALAGATLTTTRRSGPRLLALTMTVLPAALLIAGWLTWSDGSGGLLEETFRYYSRDYLPRLAIRKGLLINDNRHLFPGRWGTAFAGMVSAALAASLWRSGTGTLRQRIRDWANRPGTLPLSWLLLGALAASLGLPDMLPGEPAIFERFGVFVFLAIILIGGVERASLVTRRFSIVVIAGVLIYAGLRVQYFGAFSRDAVGLRQAFAEVPSDVILQGVPYDFTFRTHPAYGHFQDYRMAWRLGPTASELNDFRFYPVRGIAVGFSHRPFPHSRSFTARDLAPCVLVRGLPPAGIAAALATRRHAMFGKWNVWCGHDTARSPEQLMDGTPLLTSATRPDGEVQSDSSASGAPQTLPGP